MRDQTIDEYRKELADVKAALGYGELDPGHDAREGLIRNAIEMARAGKHLPRKVKTGDGPHYESRDPVADAMLAVLHR
jgi:hypothetical protein